MIVFANNPEERSVRMREFFRKSPFYWEVVVLLCIMMAIVLFANACLGGSNDESTPTSDQETVEASPETIILLDSKYIAGFGQIHVLCDTIRGNLIYRQYRGGIVVIQGGCEKTVQEPTQ